MNKTYLERWNGALKNQNADELFRIFTDMIEDYENFVKHFFNNCHFGIENPEKKFRDLKDLKRFLSIDNCSERLEARAVIAKWLKAMPKILADLTTVSEEELGSKNIFDLYHFAKEKPVSALLFEMGTNAPLKKMFFSGKYRLNCEKPVGVLYIKWDNIKYNCKSV